MALTDAFKLSIDAQLGVLELLLWKTQILKFYQPHMGKQKSFKGIIELRLGIIKSLWAIIKLLLGIAKPSEGINKPYLGDFVISSAASEAKMPERLRKLWTVYTHEFV